MRMPCGAHRAQSSAKWILSAALLIGVLVAGSVLVVAFARPRVVVTEAVEGPVVQAFYSTGTIQPDRDFPIKANVAGTLTDVRVDKGARVRKGDVLAVVTDPELKFLADKAQAEVSEKQKRADEKDSPVLHEFDARISANSSLLEIAQRDEQRIRGLLEHNAAAQQDLDASLDRVKTVWSNLEANKALRASKLLELQRDLEVARSALAIAEWNLQQQTLISPIDGVVLDRPQSPGTRVAINDRIMLIADVRPEKLVMRAAVDEEDVTRLRAGQTVRMTLYSFEGRSFEGKVTKIYDQADPERRTFEVDVKFSELEPRLQPGMTGELAFIMDEKQKAVVIPSQAVQNGAVFIVRDGRLAKVEPEIGLRGVERTEILAGLKSGGSVVISSTGDLRDGQRVRTTYTDPVAAAGLNKPKQKQDNFKGFK
jgi:RND family efflux transporter MFP subunit